MEDQGHEQEESSHDGAEAPPPEATDMELVGRVSAEVGDEILGPPGALPE
jgi:hypothetical protein